ncbi:protease [Streptomyces sp. XM4193]|uniref:protease n=1 Tax=Streptomyces sp. XM4193 TaxID=2929782 RepID=UPI001FF838A4|nr:protease [Streptomyces sp. XM4193]MCK1797566.1 protease [Streptomyces sp. XM4193]
MTKLLLTLHVIAAVVAVGPVTVAASMFPPALRRAAAAGNRTTGDEGSPRGSAPDRAAGRDGLVVLRLLHRICRVYAVFGVCVPVFGLATANSLGVLGSAWLIVSMVLTAAAAAVLGLLILPAQERELDALQGESADVRGAGADVPTRTEAPAQARPQAGAEIRTAAVPEARSVRRAAARLGMVTGIFNLLWVTVTILMIVRPGSTTSV